MVRLRIKVLIFSNFHYIHIYIYIYIIRITKVNFLLIYCMIPYNKLYVEKKYINSHIDNDDKSKNKVKFSDLPRAGIKWVIHTKVNYKYKFQFSASFINNNNKDIIKNIELIVYSEDLFQITESKSLNLKELDKIDIELIATSLLTSIFLSFNGYQGFEIHEKDYMIYESITMENEDGRELNNRDSKSLGHMCIKLKKKRLNCQTELQKYIRNNNDNNNNNNNNNSNNNNNNNKWISELDIKEKNISIIFVDLTESFNYVYHSIKYLNKKEVGVPIILIDKDYIIDDPYTYKDKYKDNYYYNFGDFPCYILQNNHNIAGSLQLIHDLIEITKAKSFSFLTSNIPRIKDVFAIHNRLFDNGFKRYKNLMNMYNSIYNTSNHGNHSNHSNIQDNPEKMGNSLNSREKKLDDLWYEILMSHIPKNISSNSYCRRYKSVVSIHIGNINLLSDVEILLMYFKESGHNNIYLFHLIEKERVNGYILKNMLKRVGIESYIVTTGPNRGMDLGGFFIHMDLLIRLDIHVDVLVKFHTKSDKNWRRQLYFSMAGNKETIIKNVQSVVDNYGVVIPEKYMNNAKTDKYNLEILDYYKRVYKWNTPEYFSAGTIFAISWSILRDFWLKESIHTLGETFYLFKSNYVTNKRESYAHGWERILSGYLPYNYCIDARVYTFPARFINSFCVNKGSILNVNDIEYSNVSRELFDKFYNLDTISYLNKTNNNYNSYLRNNWVNSDKDVNVDVVFYTVNTYINTQFKFKILWIEYIDLLNKDLLSNNIKYSIALTNEKETYQIFKSMNMKNIYYIPENKLPDNTDNPTLDNLLFNVITKNNTNNSADVITIKVYCGNDPELMYQWGDYNLAKNLKYEIEQMGLSAVIEMVNNNDNHNNNYNDFDINDFDNDNDSSISSNSIRSNSIHSNNNNNRRKVIYFGGYNKYFPRKEDFNILWFYSHPAQWFSDIKQFDLYDVICVASIPAYEELQKIFKDCKKIVKYLPQVFVYKPNSTSNNRNNNSNNSNNNSNNDRDNSEKNKKYNLSFIGNSRNVYRDVVKKVIHNKDTLKLNIWGKGWETIIPFIYHEKIRFKWVNNECLADVMNKSKVIINDHWPDMRDYGFVSMKTFEFMANKALFITDRVSRLEDISSDIIYYNSDNNSDNNDNLISLIKYYIKSYDSYLVKERIERLYNRYNEIYLKALDTLKEIL